MHYAFLIYHDEETRASVPPAGIEAEVAKHVPYIEMLRRNRQYVASDLLEPTSSAWTLRSSGGEPIASHGPFAESREQLGGYYLVDAPDLDVAIDLARRCPSLTARGGVGIEIRPTMRAPWTTEESIPHPPDNRFLLAAYREKSHDEDGYEASASWIPWIQQLRGSKSLETAEMLAPSGSASLLRWLNGKTELTDRPFREEGAQLCASFVVRARDVDAAIALVSRYPDVPVPSFEIRPIRRTVD